MHGIADLGVVGRVLRLKLNTDADGEGHGPTVSPAFDAQSPITDCRISTNARGWSPCTECPESGTTITR